MSTSDGAASGPVDLWSAFKRAHEVVRARVIADTADAAGLSEPDLTILVSLSKAGGSLRQNELAASLGWDRTRISHQLTRMSRRDLIARERSGGVTVTLTEEGRRTVAAVHPGLEAAVRRHFTDKLTAREAETLDALLRRL
ncbi:MULTISPECIES: MarR family winged helix-turn-helix transcriptional regulator [unclassified Streptomyces]|uniref:MarR family winged helix-turn-helix transcriptional regulator n=1 Tax=unclassified Streptomyces TaxID=2593676 RepID=UPI002E2ADD0D|nr:MarR family winged helix-turn-helix transcriptional regulator [Streptomyces sp. NBC_01423]WSX93807.1 MarR family winged helix-turn-helix transcriptional regulator [Streptomyces sp. NBC_00891]WSY08285.1 MarR family winged helix-turn-helix transcriptional regulator [Streptomyces sp. NBC_00890]WSZ09908.1 MarR family winged helix-turn-helix transcriptional regulator [Streptomyces sp. NBC_00869]WSZ22590.1 MarR family winged helix-turn-helix transcriptional regulator [Streptomyces sp. NBC_00870]